MEQQSELSEHAQDGSARRSPDSPFLRHHPSFGRGLLICMALLVLAVLVGFPGSQVEATAKTRVGFIVPMDGEPLKEAESLIAGFETFLKENKVSSIEILRRTSGKDNKDALTALAELVMNQEVEFLVSPPTFAGAEKCVHGTPPGKAILFVTNPAVRLVSGEMCFPSAFRVRANSYQAARPVAPWSLEHLGRKVFITGTNDTEGNEEADFFAYGFEKSGGMFVDRKMVPALEGDLQPLLNSINQSKADFVFAAFRGESAKRFIKAFRGATPPTKKPVVGPEGLISYPKPITEMSQAGLGVKSLGTLKNAEEFANRVKKSTGKEVSNAVRAAEGFEIASIVQEAASKGPKDKGNMDEMIRFVEKLEITGPRGKISFDKNHEPILPVFVQEWQSKVGALRQEILKELGPSRSLDFGCGRVGFPEKIVPGQEDEKTEKKPTG
jgi:branched-chain amino acid transport system substrate-binding protein